jgi:TM2 domain-containing membrane protein YozV
MHVMFCLKCGKENPEGAKFCTGCGSLTNIVSDPNTTPNHNNANQRPMQWKSEGTAMVITILFGIFGLGGIGHIYLGRVGKGIGILIVGIILLTIAWATIVGFIVLWIFAIWVIFNARSDTRKYNDELERTGKAPW